MPNQTNAQTIALTKKSKPLLDEKLDYQGGNHHEQDLFLILLRNLLLVHVLSTNELDQASSDNVQVSLHQWMQDIASPIFLPETQNRNYVNKKHKLPSNAMEYHRQVSHESIHLGISFLTWAIKLQVVSQYPFTQKRIIGNRHMYRL